MYRSTTNTKMNPPLLVLSPTKPSKAIIKKVEEILALKRENPAADTSALEQAIDRLVYELYGLTEEEIEIVEHSRK